MTGSAGAAAVPAIKLSSPETREFWEIPVVYEDEHLLALNKPAGLPTAPDGNDSNRPCLIRLLHAGIAQGKPWAAARRLTYLTNAHRLDSETSGVSLLAKNKQALIKLTDLFGTEKPFKSYVALVQGTPEAEEFEVNAPLAPHPTNAGMMRIDPKHGKKSLTRFTVMIRFRGYTLLQCRPLTERPHQIRIHLRHIHFPILGDFLYRGGKLFLSQIKRKYRPDKNKEERPLISTVALHAEQLSLPHPVTGEQIIIKAPWPKDLEVAVKYLKMFAGL